VEPPRPPCRHLLPSGPLGSSRSQHQWTLELALRNDYKHAHSAAQRTRRPRIQRGISPCRHPGAALTSSVHPLATCVQTPVAR